MESLLVVVVVVVAGIIFFVVTWWACVSSEIRARDFGISFSLERLEEATVKCS